ncbi:hypothetical protein CI41S_66600 [Bradyrhizobium ivorense]|nr:hypothetical protein CI41S_66600 [Bradyrhizobium ivorense]
MTVDRKLKPRAEASPWIAALEAHDVAHLGHEVWIGRALNVSSRCGWSPKARQMRCTVDTDRPLAFAMPRELQWVAFSGAVLQRPQDHGFGAGIVNRARRPGTWLVVQPGHVPLYSKRSSAALLIDA